MTDFVGYEGERALIERHWEQNWVDGTQRRTVTAYENVPFDVPSATDWARLTILNGDVAQVSSGSPGSNTHRHPGVIQVELYSLAKAGTAGLRRLMDLASEVFRNQSLGDDRRVRCWEATARLTGVDGPHLRGLVRWEFWRDEHL